MATSSSRRRPRGNITWLPSGSARVGVYGGIDQLSGKEIRLRETVRARASHRETEREALRVQTRLLNQVDERRSPRTEATVNELLDRWLDVIDVERKTRVNYIGKIEKHIRPTLGRHAVGRLKAEAVEGLYAQLRRCRHHCRGRTYVQHRTAGEHTCDEHSARRPCAKLADPNAPCRWCDRACAAHRCQPLAPGSIRVIHAILSGAFTRAVRWGWIAVSPVEQTEPPPTPRPNPEPPTASEAATLVTSARAADPDWGTLVMFAMTTGARRGEVCGLRWPQLNLDVGVVAFRGSVGQIAGDRWEKDTKTHQHRRVTLDSALIDVLRLHGARAEHVALGYAGTSHTAQGATVGATRTPDRSRRPARGPLPASSARRCPDRRRGGRGLGPVPAGSGGRDLGREQRRPTGRRLEHARDDDGGEHEPPPARARGRRRGPRPAAADLARSASRSWLVVSGAGGKPTGGPAPTDGRPPETPPRAGPGTALVARRAHAAHQAAKPRPDPHPRRRPRLAHRVPGI